ncbi:retrovirus-related pol polyprotein from transposon TNT 1-94 [Tanacetum coccineum]
MNSVSVPISNAHVNHSVRNAKFESICAIWNKCLFDANHDMCLVDFVNDMNLHSKSKSKRNKKSKAWKHTGKVFTDVGYKWKLIGRFFTIVGNSCPLTRITPKKIVHLKETTPNSVETPKPEIKVYSRIPKQIKLVGTIRFGNDQVAKIMGYGDYQLGNTKSWLWHRRLSHLNFGTLNKLAKDGLARVPLAHAPRAIDLADSPVSTSIDQDAPSTSIPSTQDQEHSPILFQGFKESREQIATFS